MESFAWNLRTLGGFVLGAPLLKVVLFVLVMYWDYPLLALYSLLRQSLGRHRSSRGQTAVALPVLVVIPTLLRKRDELTSMMSTVESIATNGYPGTLLIVLSIDGTKDAPLLYGELQTWARRSYWRHDISVQVTGTPDRRSKPMAIEQGIEFVTRLVERGEYFSFPPVYVSTDADADLGPNALEHIVRRLCRRHPITGWPTRIVAGALHVRGNNFWRGWRNFFTVEGQLNLQVAREYYVSNISRHNIRWLPLSGVPGAFYCTWSSLFVSIPRFLGYVRTLKVRHWLGWWLGIAPPRFSDSTAPALPELMAGDTDDTVTAYVATMARYEDGRFSLDPPRTPLHALFYMLRGLLLDRAIQYEPQARVFTSSPTTIRSLMKQRKRWNSSRIELAGRFWPVLGYHFHLALTVAVVKLFMARSAIIGILMYFLVPLAFWRSYMATAFVLTYACNVFCHALMTLMAILINGELHYWRLALALPLSPTYMFWFNWVPGTIGAISDVLLFGNVTGFAPESTLIKGGSFRIAVMYRLKRFASMTLRSLIYGDVPLGSFWFGWRHTPWTPSGFEGFTSNERRAIFPPHPSLRPGPRNEAHHEP